MGNWIKTTTDYGWFKTMRGNRAINYKKVQELIRSIQNHGYRSVPIVVNNDMEVIDGQHRLAALKHMKMPVPYIVDEGATLEECIALNSFQTRWKQTDYVEANVAAGNEDYIILKKFLERHKPYGIATITFAINGSRANSPGIRNGFFTVYDKSEAHLLEAARNLKTLAEICGNKHKSTTFEQAALFAMSVDGVHRDRLVKKLQPMLEASPKLATFADWEKAIEKAYNKGARADERIYFSTEYQKWLMGRAARISENSKGKKKAPRKAGQD